MPVEYTCRPEVSLAPLARELIEDEVRTVVVLKIIVRRDRSRAQYA